MNQESLANSNTLSKFETSHYDLSPRSPTLSAMDLFKCPPDISTAKKLSKNSKTYKNFETKEPYELCFPVSEARNIDIGIRAYFLFMRYLVMIVFFVFFIYFLSFLYFYILITFFGGERPQSIQASDQKHSMAWFFFYFPLDLDRHGSHSNVSL